MICWLATLGADNSGWVITKDNTILVQQKMNDFGIQEWNCAKYSIYFNVCLELGFISLINLEKK